MAITVTACAMEVQGSRMRRSPIKASKKTRTRRNMVKVLDADARAQVFERDGYRCVRCNSQKGIQWCHIFTRRNLSTRWERENALTLCAGCHLWWHEHLAISVPWFIKNWPQRYEAMLAKFNDRSKIRVSELYAELQGGE